MSFKLRGYQKKSIGEVRQHMRRGVKGILHTAPTGSGKTVVAAYMIGTSAQRGYAAWFVVHRRELVKQTMEAFHDAGIRYGVCAAGFDSNPNNPVQICSIQTLTRRFHKIHKPSLIVFDESHHLAAASWRTIYDAFPKAFHVGLTATPTRLDGRGLGRWFKVIVNGPSVAWLIERGYLAKYRLFCPSNVDVSDVDTLAGDFVRGQLSRAVDKAMITGDVIKHYNKLARGKRAVVFCCSVQHSQHVVKQFTAAGIRAEHVDGTTKDSIRDGAMARFKAGTTKVLSNCDLFGEGVDVPAMQVAILLRPTMSLSVYLQQVGRTLRPHKEKKYAIILDHVGNAMRHGLPDEDRVWTLEDRDRKKRENETSTPIRICPSCYAAQPPGFKCRHCGYEFKVAGRKPEEVDGELVEVEMALEKRRRRWEQAQALTWKQLVVLGKKWKYKFPERWASHVIQNRQRRKLLGGK